MIGKLEKQLREELMVMRAEMGQMLNDALEKLEYHEEKMEELEQEIRGDLEQQHIGAAQLEQIRGNLERQQIGSANLQLSARKSLLGDLQNVASQRGLTDDSTTTVRPQIDSKVFARKSQIAPLIAEQIQEQMEQLRSKAISEESAKQLEMQKVEEPVRDTVRRSTVSRRRSELPNLAAGAGALTVGGSANQPGSVRDMLTDLGSQLESLTEAMQEEQELRIALAEQVQANTAALEGALHEGLAAHKTSFAEEVSIIQQKFDADLNLLHQEHSEKHSSHQTALQEGLQNTLTSVHEKLKADLSALESGMNGTHSNLNALVADLTAQVDTLTSTVQADSALRVAVEEKLERKCKELRTDADQALDKAMREVHGELKKEVKEHKERTEKERQALQKDLTNHKSRSDEEKRARDAAHSNLHTELRNRDRAHKGLDGKMDDVEKRLKSALDALSTKHQTHAESMSSTERRLRDEISKLNQGATARQSEVERKLREEFNTVQTKLEKRISELAVGFDGKQGSLREMVTKVVKDVDFLNSSVQTEVRQRTAAEDKLNSKCDGLRAEITQVAKEPIEALRNEFSQFGSKNKELEAAMQGANETLRKDVRDHKAFVQSEIDALSSRTAATERAQSTVQGQSTSTSALYRKAEDTPGMVRESDVRQAVQSDMELMNARLRDQLTTLRNDLADVEKKLRKEIKRIADDSVQDQREGFREIREDIDRINSEHNVQHKETRVMIIEHIRSILQDADGKVRLSLEDLRREVEDHRDNLKTHLTSQRGLDTESLLTAAVQRLEEDMERFHTLSGEVTQLKLDQDLAQGNLDRRLQDLDLLAGSFEELQADHDSLRRTVDTNTAIKEATDGWEEEVRRIWEAIDTHTHDVSVEDFEEQEKPTKSVVKTQVLREVPQTPTTRVMQAPIQRIGGIQGIATAPSIQATIMPTSPKPNFRMPQTVPIAATPMVPATRELHEAPMRPARTIVSPRATPNISPMGSTHAPVGPVPVSTASLVSRNPSLVSPLGTAQFVQQPTAVAAVQQPTAVATAVERVEPSSPMLHARQVSTASLLSSQMRSMPTAVEVATRTDVTATVGKAMHNIRPAEQRSASKESIISERDDTPIGRRIISETEETTIAGRIHHHLEAHVGKAVFEHVSELDPETRHDH